MAMPQKPIKAHAEIMAPYQFTFHDFEHIDLLFNNIFEMIADVAFKTAVKLFQKKETIDQKAIMDRAINYAIARFELYQKTFREIVLAVRQDFEQGNIESYKKSITALFATYYERITWTDDFYFCKNNFDEMLDFLTGVDFTNNSFQSYKNYFQTNAKTGESLMSDQELINTFLSLETSTLNNHEEPLNKEENPYYIKEELGFLRLSSTFQEQISVEDIKVIRTKNQIFFICYEGQKNQISFIFETLYNIIYFDTEDLCSLLNFAGIEIALPEYNSPTDVLEAKKTEAYLQKLEDGFKTCGVHAKSRIKVLLPEETQKTYSEKMKALDEKYLN